MQGTYYEMRSSYVMRCAIWYHLYNLKNVKNTHGEPASLLKLTLLHECFSRFLNWYQIPQRTTYVE